MQNPEKTQRRGGFASRAFGLCFMLAACPLIATPAEAATNWNWVQTGGGCYTANVVYSEVQQGLAYARTDVGGAYRWDSATSQWVFLLDSTSWSQVTAFPNPGNWSPKATDLIDLFNRVGLPASLFLSNE